MGNDRNGFDRATSHSWHGRAMARSLARRRPPAALLAAARIRRPREISRWRRSMKLEGSCHCRAVKFTVTSHTPYPYMRCYCSICRKTAGGGGFAINIMGIGQVAVGARHEARQRLSGAHSREERCTGHALAGPPALLREMRQRALGLGPAVGGVGLSVRVGDRHAACRNRPRSRRSCSTSPRRGAPFRRSAGTRTFASIPRRASRDWHAKRGLTVK